jgi:hypothetical protein
VGFLRRGSITLTDLALVQGIAPTRAALTRWNERPWPVLRAWLAGSVAVSVGLLLAVWAVAAWTTPDPTGFFLVGFADPTIGHAVDIVGRNSLVLALHALACVAGFIAGSSLPAVAQRQRGVSRVVHDHAGRFAMAFVCAATAFSLTTQAYVLGDAAATLASDLHIAPGVLLAGLLAHALPELVALFLPLAAWIIASRRGAWDELLAATVVTVGLALPVLVVAAFVEVFVSPSILRSLAS